MEAFSSEALRREERMDFARKQYRFAFSQVVVQRLYAEAIPRGKQALFAFVPDQKSEHSDKTVEARFAPFLVGREHDFGVRLAVVGVVLKLLAQFQKL